MSHITRVEAKDTMLPVTDQISILMVLVVATLLAFYLYDRYRKH